MPGLTPIRTHSSKNPPSLSSPSSVPLLCPCEAPNAWFLSNAIDLFFVLTGPVSLTLWLLLSLRFIPVISSVAACGFGLGLAGLVPNGFGVATAFVVDALFRNRSSVPSSIHFSTSAHIGGFGAASAISADSPSPVELFCGYKLTYTSLRGQYCV